jgi:phosphoglycolate phosphatase-like HAD superfamily hydrolase
VIEAVIFDLDGTLVHLPINYEALFNEFKRIMRVPEVRPIVETISKLDGKTRETVFRAWDRAELSATENVTENEEGMGIYRQFEDKRKALVTLQGQAVVEEIVKKRGLVFDFVLTRENSLFRVDQLKKAISLLREEPQNVLFVGNTDSDASGAMAVGCQFRRVK